MRTNQPRVVETGCVPETFVTDIGRIEQVGSTSRIVLCVRRTCAGEVIREIVHNLIVPTEMLDGIAREVLRGPQPLGAAIEDNDDYVPGPVRAN